MPSPKPVRPAWSLGNGRTENSLLFLLNFFLSLSSSCASALPWKSCHGTGVAEPGLATAVLRPGDFSPPGRTFLVPPCVYWGISGEQECSTSPAGDPHLSSFILLYPHLQVEVFCSSVAKFSTTLSKCSIMGLQGLIQGPKDWE